MFIVVFFKCVWVFIVQKLGLKCIGELSRVYLASFFEFTSLIGESHFRVISSPFFTNPK